ncbi:methyl-accepting chemotaxis protein [Morganella morganii]|nr:methyl-accepting chemotaxis protein [Morganella morganii]
MLNIMKKWFFLQKKQSAIPGEVPAVFPEPATRAVMADSDEQQCVHGEILCRHLLEGMAVIEIIRNSLLDSGTRLAGEQGTLDEIALHNSETRRYMQELCSVLDDISEHADKGLDYTQKLISVLGQINQNINNIERLANQTNLLAVNSAIEASHVGSRGPGFRSSPGK